MASGRVGESARARIRIGVAMGVVMALMAGVAPSGASAERASLVARAEQTDESSAAREAQTARTAEFGVDRPIGIGYDSAREVFVVVGEGDGVTSVVQVDDFGGGADAAVLDVDDPSVDAVNRSLSARNPEDGLRYVLDDAAGRLDAIDEQGDIVARHDVSSIPWDSPEAMTFAPSTDSTDDPSVHHLFVVDSGTDEVGGSIFEVTLTEFALSDAPVDQAGLIRAVPTSEWSPPSSDPSGITWLPDENRLLIVDSEIEEIQPPRHEHQLWADVNMWEVTLTGVVTRTGATWGPLSSGNYSDEPTGLGYAASTDTLFISDDDNRAIFVVRRGPDGVFGTADDIVTTIDVSGWGVTDAEDPEFDPVTGHLFFLSGADREVHRIDPGPDGLFGTADDSRTQFDIGHLGADFEGLTKSPTRETLYVGERSARKIFEIQYDGTLVRVIDATPLAQFGLRYISGLTLAPSSVDASAMSLYIVDRGVDEVNDGVLFEISAPDLTEAGMTNLPPLVDAGFDQSVALPGSVSLAGTVADDGLPSGALTQEWSVESGPGAVNFADPTSTATSVSFDVAGTYVLRLTANDGQYSSSATLTITVLPGNRPPMIESIDDVVMAEGDSVVVPIVASDPDGDPFTVTTSGLPSFGTFDEGDLTITLSPLVGDAGSYGPVSVSVTDEPGPGPGVAPVFVGASSASTGTSTDTIVVARPGGVEAGDVLLAQVRFRGSSASELTPPEGWVLLGALSDSQSNHAVLYRVASGSEPSVYSFVQVSAGGKMAAAVAAYRGVDQSDPIDAWAASPVNTSTLVAPDVVSTVDNAMVVRLWGFRGYHDGSGYSGNVVPEGVTKRWESHLMSPPSGTDRNRVLGGDQVQVLPGAVGTATASGSTHGIENRRSAFTVVLRPA